MTHEEECVQRMDGCAYILVAGKALKLSNLTIYTACLYFNIYFCRHPFKNKKLKSGVKEKGGGTRKNPHCVASTCLYVAGKVEDEAACAHGHLLDCITAAWSFMLKTSSRKDVSCNNLKRIMIETEVEILDTVEYAFVVEHPFTLLPELCFKLFGPDYADDPTVLREIGKEGGLASTAWLMLMDSVTTTLCVQYPPSVIVAGALHNALQIMGIEVKKKGSGSGGDGRQWLQMLCVDEEGVNDVCTELLKANTRSRVKIEQIETWLADYKRPLKRERSASSQSQKVPPKTNKQVWY